MAKPRVWERLSDTTRKRYISKGRSLDQTPEQVRAYYESGGTMGAYRGHKPHYGASERQWSAMLAAARRSRLDEDGNTTQILENLLAKGFKPNWIVHQLDLKADSRDAYRSPLNRAKRKAKRGAGREPGASRYKRRVLIADVEIYWYH